MRVPVAVQAEGLKEFNAFVKILVVPEESLLYTNTIVASGNIDATY